MLLLSQNCETCVPPRGSHQQPRAAATPTLLSAQAVAGCRNQPARRRHGCTDAPIGRRGAAAARSSRAGNSGSSIDVVGLGNLCVDAVLPMDELPPTDVSVRRKLLDTLTASPPDQSSWEVGGNCNFMVAAARLGLRVASVGHISRDVYGNFMDEVLQQEGIQATTRIAPLPAVATTPTNGAPAASHNGANPHPHHPQQQPQPQHPQPVEAVGGGLDSTLICFVLVDPASRHAFCSRYDFGPWPLLEGIGLLPDEAMQVLRAARAIFTNGFIFDELPLATVEAACMDAIAHGAAIFFDPGPRCQTMLEGPRRAALDLLLDLSAVVLMTEEEARVVTGLEDPEAAARQVLSRPGARAQWVVVKMGGQGALLCSRRGAAARGGNGNGNVGSGSGSSNGAEQGVVTTQLGAVKVQVVDTVGCGDSFASAVVMGFINGWAPDVTLALANAVGGATATGRGAGRNVARLDVVLRLLEEGAAGGAREAGRAAFARARELLLASLAAGEEGKKGQGRQLSAAA